MYKPETEFLLNEVKTAGFNIWAMVGLYRKRSKLSPQIPDEVVQGVCREYLVRKGTIKSDFPYFLTVLQRQTRAYFAAQQISEHAKIKAEPTAIKDIFKMLAQ